MNVILLLIGFLALLLVVGRLTRLVVRDGLGSNPPPRSHADQLGSWVERELRR